MKKIIKKIICILCLRMIITGCSGIADYRIILNNDYYVAKTFVNNEKYLEQSIKILQEKPHQYLYIIKIMM